MVIFLHQKESASKRVWETVAQLADCGSPQYVMANDRYPYSFAVLLLTAAATCPHHPHFLSVLFTYFSVMRDASSQVWKAPISFVHLERPLACLSTCISANFMKICRANPDFVEIGQKFGHFI